MSYFEDQKAIAHIEKAIREGRNPGAIWSEGQGEINGFINRHSHEAFQDEIAKAKIRLNPNNTQDGDVQAYQRRLWKREDEYKRADEKAKRNQSQNSQSFPTTYNVPSSNQELKNIAYNLSNTSDKEISDIAWRFRDIHGPEMDLVRKEDRERMSKREAEENKKRAENPKYARQQDALMAEYERKELTKKNKEIDSNALFSLLAGPFLFFFPSLFVALIVSSTHFSRHSIPFSFC